MREESSGRTLTVWDVQATMTGFVAEYAYRTHDEIDSVAVGCIVAHVHEGRIDRLYLTCGGNWDVETQERVHARPVSSVRDWSGPGHDGRRDHPRPGRHRGRRRDHGTPVHGDARIPRARDGAPRLAARAVRRPRRTPHCRRARSCLRHRRPLRPGVAGAAGDRRTRRRRRLGRRADPPLRDQPRSAPGARRQRVTGVRRLAGAAARRCRCGAPPLAARPTATGPASASASTATTSGSARGCSTAVRSSASWSRTGCRRYPTSPRCCPATGRVPSTSAAASAGRASRWRRPIRDSPSSASTATTPR